MTQKLDSIGWTTLPTLCLQFDVFSNRALFKECLWTAHAVKVLPIEVDLSWKTIEADDTLPALPP